MQGISVGGPALGGIGKAGSERLQNPGRRDAGEACGSLALEPQKISRLDNLNG